MAYGEGKRSYTDKEIGAVNIMGFGITAAIGIAAAVVVDLVQQREASALYVINRWIIEVTSLLGLETIPLYGVMLLLMVIGGGSVLFLQPVTARGAFAQGFGALAALVTLAPSDLGTPLEAPDRENSEFNQSVDDAFSTPASLRINTSTLAATTVQSSQTYQLRIEIEFPNGLREDVQTMVRKNSLAGKLWNPETGTRYSLFRSSGAEMSYKDEKLRIVTKMTGPSSVTDLWILVEAEGYDILEQKFEARAGANPVWKVKMEESRQPLFLQRLRHSYRF